MKFKNCYGKSFEANEGSSVKIKCDNDSKSYDMIGIVILSLGIILSQNGSYCELTDAIDLKRTRPIKKDQVKKMFEDFDVDDLYLFYETAEIAKSYIKTAKSKNRILPLEYKNNLFKDKENLLKFVSTL